MLLGAIPRDITKVKKFPAGKNVRVRVEGLGVCQFDDRNSTSNTESVCNFLRHVQHHKLQFSIVRMDPNGKVDVCKEITEIREENKVIIIDGDDLERPSSYIHPPQTGEYGLDRLINLSNLHKEQFTLANLQTLTKMTLKNCSFYTSEITKKDYRIKLKGTIVKETDHLCEVMGAYINCKSGTIDIDIPGLYSKKLPIQENGISYKYEIAFSNHCHESDSNCLQVLGGDGADTKFLYDVLTPRKNNTEKLILEEVKCDAAGKELVTPNVAACLLGGTEPCSEC